MRLVTSRPKASDSSAGSSSRRSRSRSHHPPGLSRYVAAHTRCRRFSATSFSAPSSPHSAATPAWDRAELLVAQERSYRTAAGKNVRIWFTDSVDEARVREWLVDFVGSLLHGNESAKTWSSSRSRQPGSPSGVAPMRLPATCRLFPTSSSRPSRIPVVLDRRGDPRARVRPPRREQPHQPAVGCALLWDEAPGELRRRLRCRLRRSVFPGRRIRALRPQPGRGFAEAYRVANQRRLGVPEAPWRLVDERFYPDATAAALIEQDVLEPWTAHSTATYRGQFTRRGPNRQTFEVATDSMGLRWPASSHQGAPSSGLRKQWRLCAGKRATYFTVRHA